MSRPLELGMLGHWSPIEAAELDLSPMRGGEQTELQIRFANPA